MWHRLEDQTVPVDPPLHTGNTNHSPEDEADINDMTFDPEEDRSEETCDFESDDDMDFQVVGQECSIRTCWHYKYCYVCVYIVLVVVLLAALIALVVVILLVVVPFARAATFLPGKCQVIGANKHLAEGTCSCGKGCDSRYPCMLIDISYSSEEGVFNTSIYENEVLLDKQCSFYPPCKTSRAENIATVQRYENKYGSFGRVYNCLYNPHVPHEVIRTRRFQLHHVIHGIVWSTLILLSAFTSLILAIKRKQCAFL